MQVGVGTGAGRRPAPKHGSGEALLTHSIAAAQAGRASKSRRGDCTACERADAGILQVLASSAKFVDMVKSPSFQHGWNMNLEVHK